MKLTARELYTQEVPFLHRWVDRATSLRGVPVQHLVGHTVDVIDDHQSSIVKAEDIA